MQNAKSKCESDYMFNLNPIAFVFFSIKSFRHYKKLSKVNNSCFKCEQIQFKAHNNILSII